MLSYVIVGSGYRAEYFGRIAAAYPTLFRAKYLCRSEEKAAHLTRATGVDATTSPEECLAFEPDFAVISVDRSHTADVAEEWVRRGVPVLAETPVASTWEQIARIEELARRGAKIVCCEQYHRQPILAAGLAEIAAGTIGEPSSMYISLVHDYHAPSLIRRALRLERGDTYTVTGCVRNSPVARTDSRIGAFYDGALADAERTTALIQFSSGKTAVYDFATVQYRSYIRSRHITVRGTRGEWTDTMVTYLDENNQPRRKMLTGEIPERYRCLDSQLLRDRRRNWTAELAPDTVQDEFAIATMLLDMGDYVRGGEPPYPLWEALDDARFWLELQKLNG